MNFLQYNAKTAVAVAIALFSGILFLATPASAETSCQVVREAAIKMADSPHFTMTQLIKGTPGPIKVIGDANGIHGDDGKNRERIGERADFAKKMRQSFDATTFSKCAIIRSDTIDGKAMAVYSYEISPGRSETMWIGKKDGRVYRTEDDDRNGMIANYID